MVLTCYYKAWQVWKQTPESSLVSLMSPSRGWLAGPPAISWTALHMPYGRGLNIVFVYLPENGVTKCLFNPLFTVLLLLSVCTVYGYSIYAFLTKAQNSIMYWVYTYHIYYRKFLFYITIFIFLVVEGVILDDIFIWGCLIGPRPSSIKAELSLAFSESYFSGCSWYNIYIKRAYLHWLMGEAGMGGGGGAL